MKEVEKRLSDMAVLIKNVTTYQKTKPVYEAYKKAKDKGKYKAAHESDIILFETAARAIKAAEYPSSQASPPCNPNIQSCKNRKKPCMPIMEN